MPTNEGGVVGVVSFVFHDAAATEIYTLCLHDGLAVLATKRQQARTIICAGAQGRQGVPLSSEVGGRYGASVGHTGGMAVRLLS